MREERENGKADRKKLNDKETGIGLEDARRLC